mmetsp:Transcript_20250/g.60408  ORF Transcript_20250/g.60408 Transcript_20250/m.60408 type:complete len:163 (-) Transcript_20250:28-516(-)|eukprot:CAMPEP_0119259906 /NCGR_PEP_ID=MMETSP1329-20130426/533_1 /TAXON_ID=114041 /ORGANISM="Genus nov. species nov., Strain RCC1024" /LENGTH=162 /DNA_ID=CAMNT_0007259315 /DNA_START=261 /DNA_END=749 /DNA_ORIENTATION=-
MVRLLTLALLPFAAAVKEAATGFDFPAKHKLGALKGLGVRKKGPIKVYAVGRYETKLKASNFLLKMSMGVGAEKMANALVAAVEPRCKDKAAVEDFKDMMIGALPDGCKKRTELAFSTTGGKLALAVNGKARGAVASKPLCKAFCDVYTDKKAVCTLCAVEE